MMNILLFEINDVFHCEFHVWHVLLYDSKKYYLKSIE